MSNEMESFNITKAKARVLYKAAQGYVMISGGFSGETDPHCIYQHNFDRRSHIETLLVAGFLVPGEGANQFVLSPSGAEVISKLPKSFRWTSVSNSSNQED
jgi:hypothetical protein